MTAAGIAVRADGAGFDRRRRAKTPEQVAGIRRAQRACESAMEAVRAALRRDGVTSEDLHAAISHAFIDAGHDPDAGDRIARPAGGLGPQQRLGADPARASRSSSTSSRSTPSTGCYSDMTRTFCIGELTGRAAPSTTSCVAEALERSKAAAGPGVPGSGGVRRGRRGVRGRRACRRCARRRRTRCSIAASCTGSATASASRSTRSPYLHLADDPAAAGRRDHARARLLPARASAAAGSRTSC